MDLLGTDGLFELFVLGLLVGFWSGFMWSGEEGGKRDISEVAEEEEGQLLEVTKEVLESRGKGLREESVLRYPGIELGEFQFLWGRGPRVISRPP